MKRRALVTLGLGALIASAALLVTNLGGIGSRRPTPADGSIILISLDTLRADRLNYDGYDEYPTSPFLDRLAADAVVFERCITTVGSTLPSHMSLLTGLHPQNHGVSDDRPLNRDIPMLQSLLKEAGFRTQAFVDAGYLDSHWGFDRGFDGYYDDGMWGLEKLAGEAIDWLDDNADEPFFLLLHTYDVHSRGRMPLYQARSPHRGKFSAGIESSLRTDDPEEFERRWRAIEDDVQDADRRYVQATYAEGVRDADAQVERFFDYLKEAGIFDRALIIVWSDHGEGLFNHGAWGHGPLYDHTLRVPLLMRFPGGERGPARVRSVVSSIDIMPTILEYAELPIPESLDGSSLLDRIGREDEFAVAFSSRAKRHKGQYSIRSNRHHLMLDSATGERLFFDLDADPLELENLSPSGLESEAALEQQLIAWIEGFDGDQVDTASGTEPEVAPQILDNLRALGYLE